MIRYFDIPFWPWQHLSNTFLKNKFNMLYVNINILTLINLYWKYIKPFPSITFSFILVNVTEMLFSVNILRFLFFVPFWFFFYFKILLFIASATISLRACVFMYHIWWLRVKIVPNSFLQWEVLVIIVFTLY